jgi:cullin 1
LIRTGVEKNLTTPMGQKPMEMKEYMECYTAVHVFCTHQKAAPSTTSFGSSDHKGGAHLLGEVLYAYLKEYLFEYVQSVRARLEKFKGEELLKMYVEEWKHFRDGAQKNARLLMYLNRHWVLRVLDEGGHEKVYEILPLHTMLWEEVVLDVSQDVIREEVLRIIERWRDGEVVDEELVRGVVEASRESSRRFEMIAEKRVHADEDSD